VLSPTWVTWRGMLGRCKRDKDYVGVTVCDRWQKFENFLADMGERPTGLTIEREDRSKGYEPGNCVWASRLAQTLNRRNTIWVALNGRTMCMNHWCREFGISQQTVYYRRNVGWSWERIFSTPLKPNRRRKG
jgi:hypothetical protein